METKPSFYTTEFWMVLLLQIILTLNTLNIWIYIHPQWVSIVMQAILASFYTVGRGIAKSKAGVDPNNPGTYKLIPRLKHYNNRR